MHLLRSLSGQLRPRQCVHELPGRQQRGGIVLGNRAGRRYDLGSCRGVHCRGRLPILYRHRQRTGRLSIAYPDSFADGYLYTYSNSNSYVYSHADTNLDTEAVANAQSCTEPETSPNTCSTPVARLAPNHWVIGSFGRLAPIRLSLRASCDALYPQTRTRAYLVERGVLCLRIF
jgi:hypothetical protein